MLWQIAPFAYLLRQKISSLLYATYIIPGEVKGVPMYGKIISSALIGIEGIPICVEADVNDGLPTFTMVGYLSASVKEAGERVRTALKNSGFHIPPKRITINLSPGNVRKNGTSYDLPIAIAVLNAMGLFCDVDFSQIAIIGEIGLDGNIKPVSGILSMVHSCSKQGIKQCIIPKENEAEALLVENMTVIGVSYLKEVVDLLQYNITPAKEQEKEDNRCIKKTMPKIDFSDIKGQEMLKRGMEIAVSGVHNILMTGAAGSGKSMLAKRIPTIMPELSFEEQMEVTKIYSISNMLTDTSQLMNIRPFRAPHHTISEQALVGGGVCPRPGEISLSHRGVLFLDELPEFKKSVLEVLRQPLEEKKIMISRVQASYMYPADFMLVAAMNPCPCGFFPDRNRCTCSYQQIRRYQSKISGPLLDRIDINMEVKQVNFHELFNDEKQCSSKEIRERVRRVREIQKNRFREDGILFNSQLDGELIKKYIRLDQKEQEILEKTFVDCKLSARGMYRILRLARTIADMDESYKIKASHLTEALFFRNNGGLSYDNI